MNVIQFAQDILYQTLYLFFNRLTLDNYQYSLGWLILSPKIIKIVARAVLARSKSGGSRIHSVDKGGGENGKSVQNSNK